MIIAKILIEKYKWEEKRDERFYEEWPKRREKGFLINFIWGTLASSVFIVLMVSIGQLFGNGLTPFDVVNSLPREGILKVIILIIAFSSITGVVNWYESAKEKIFIVSEITKYMK